LPKASAPTALTALAEDFKLPPSPRVETKENISSPASAVLARLQFLRVEAELENVPFSDASRDALWSFLREFDPTVRPRLYLNQNGNLRALWKNSEGEQIGLEFLGGGAIQFVIFKRRKGIATMMRVAGIESENRIFAHIRASDAQGLLFS
jgi:hypothetical protein